MVIAVTFVVILTTLVLHGLTMPAVVRRSRLSRDPRELDEELLAEQTSLQAALAALPGTARTIGSPPAAVDAIQREYAPLLERIHREEGNPALAGGRRANPTTRMHCGSRCSRSSASRC
jgi:hypothetical protein